MMNAKIDYSAVHDFLSPNTYFSFKRVRSLQIGRQGAAHAVFTRRLSSARARAGLSLLRVI